MRYAARKCPACHSGLYISSSKGESPCFTRMYYQCSNVLCGATFNGTQTIDQQLSPSGLEKPLMVLPVSPAVERMRALQAMRPESDQLDLLDTQEASA